MTQGSCSSCTLWTLKTHNPPSRSWVMKTPIFATACYFVFNASSQQLNLNVKYVMQWAQMQCTSTQWNHGFSDSSQVIPVCWTNQDQVGQFFVIPMHCLSWWKVILHWQLAAWQPPLAAVNRLSSLNSTGLVKWQSWADGFLMICPFVTASDVLSVLFHSSQDQGIFRGWIIW